MSLILDVSGLRVTRGDTVILHGLDWRVRRGEHWTILGANGCGKTTLLKTLLGYLSPTGGDIALLGQRYGETDWRDLRLKLGIVTSALQASVPAAEPAIETVVSGRYAQLDLWLTPTRADIVAAKKRLRSLGAARLAVGPLEPAAFAQAAEGAHLVFNGLAGGAEAQVAALDPARAVVVVTNDQAVLHDVKAAGANTISSDIFLAVAR
jgi:ABC-type branched-subunit amino acid transport system ATPase component